VSIAHKVGMTTILITGATGTVGHHLVEALSDNTGVDVRVASRRPDQLSGMAGVTPVLLDWEDPVSIAAVVHGVDSVYLLTPVIEHHDEPAARLIEAAVAAGVHHIVRQSTVGAELTPGFLSGRWHRVIEDALASSSIPHTILRANLFMDDFITYFPPGPDGVIRLPLAGSATSYIDARDIAVVAARVLVEGSRHYGRLYTLTGPEALTTDAVAAVLATATRRDITYSDVSEADAQAALESLGMPGWIVQSLLEMYAMMREGSAAAVTDAVSTVTGAQPRRFSEFAADHAQAWSSP
jgi:uncharacterized protein YbjT (DUF2867 family)